MKKLLALFLILSLLLPCVCATDVVFDRTSEGSFVTVHLGDQGYSYVRDCEQIPEFLPALEALIGQFLSGALTQDQFTEQFVALEMATLDKVYAMEDQEFIKEIEAEWGVKATQAQCRFDKATGTVLEVLNDGVLLVVPDTIDGVTVTAFGENAIKNKTQVQMLFLPMTAKNFDRVVIRSCPNLKNVVGAFIHVTAKPWADCPKLQFGDSSYQSVSALNHFTSNDGSGQRICFGKSFAVASGTIVGQGRDYGWEKDLTRAEALTIILRLMGLEEQAKAKMQEKPAFTDVMASSAWFNGYANLAWEKGITKGVGGGKFNPRARCSAQDFITMLFRLTDLTEGKDYSWSTAVEDFGTVMRQTETLWRSEAGNTGFSHLGYFFADAADQLCQYIYLNDSFCRAAAVDIIWYMLHIDAGANHLTLADILADRYGMSEQVLFDNYARRSLNGLDSAVVAAVRKQEQHGSSPDYGQIRYIYSDAYQQRLSKYLGWSLYNTEGLSEFEVTLNTALYLGKNGDAIAQKAREICAGLPTEREKALAISNWICSHIFYDNTNYDGTNASGAFLSRHGVCHDYASLTMAMCHAVGVSCAYISSNPLGNHAYNLIYWDGAWHPVDNTWISRLSYKNGQFYNGDTVVANYLEPGPSQRMEEWYDAAPMDFYDDREHSLDRKPMALFAEG